MPGLASIAWAAAMSFSPFASRFGARVPPQGKILVNFLARVGSRDLINRPS